LLVLAVFTRLGAHGVLVRLFIIAVRITPSSGNVSSTSIISKKISRIGFNGAQAYNLAPAARTSSSQYRTDPSPLVAWFHKGTSGGAMSDILDDSVQTVSRSALPISGDSEIFPGGGVCRLLVPWLLVPRPAAGVQRFRADPGYLCIG
jgi:hypothetical protein